MDSEDAMTSAEKELEIAEQEAAFVRNVFRTTSNISQLSLDATFTASQLHILRGYFDILLVALDQYMKHSLARGRYLVIIDDSMKELTASMTGPLTSLSKSSVTLEGTGAEQ